MSTTPLFPILRERPLPCLLALALASASAPLSAQTNFYWGGGTTDIADDTTLPTLWSSLHGTWDTTTRNWADSPASPNTYQTWQSGGIFNGTFDGFDSGYSIQTAVISLAENINVSGINVRVGFPGASGNKWAAFDAAGAVSLSLADNAVIDVSPHGSTALGVATTAGLMINSSSGAANVSLAGDGFSKTGNRTLIIRGDHDLLTGTINVTHDAKLDGGNSAGILSLNDGGSLRGVTRFNVSATGLSSAGAPQGGGGSYGTTTRLTVRSTSGVNQLNDAAVISLGGVGAFDYVGHSGTSEVAGALRLESSGVLIVDSTISGQGSLTFANGIDRANNRSQLLVGVNSSGELASTVNLGTSHGLGSGLLPWMTDSKARFLRVDESNNLAVMTSTDVSDVSTVTNGAVNYRIVGNSTQLTNTTFASGAEANTLGFYRGTSSNPVTVTITDTLTLTSGGLAVANDNSNTQVTIQGGSSLTTADGNALYISTGYASTGGTVTIMTPITGDIDVAKTGASQVTFGGSAANTYTGTTYVNGGTLSLAKTAGVTSIAGDVVVRTGGTLSMSSSNQIADTAMVTVEKGGFFNTANNSETFARLAGGGMILANTPAAITTVTTSVSVGDDGIGTLINNRVGTLSRFAMAEGAVFDFELAGDGGISDQMVFYNFNDGEFVLNANALNLALVGPRTEGEHTVSLFTFFSDNGETLVEHGIVGGLLLGTLGEGITAASIAYNGTSIDLTYTVVAAIPEPSTSALGVAGMCAALVLVRRRKRA
ncbi:MAG: hypothetical protein ABII82_06720 [Verrucomicrobiota bacterium]